jgi:aryl-alcohol dehydrogenase-like predicted oxidoreductase
MARNGPTPPKVRRAVREHLKRLDADQLAIYYHGRDDTVRLGSGDQQAKGPRPAVLEALEHASGTGPDAALDAVRAAAA